MPEALSFIPIDSTNQSYLWAFLYQAIYVPPGAEPPAREMIYRPELARYVEGWGRPGDLGLYAVIEGSPQPVGAAWLRRWTGDQRGYGWVQDDVPELSLAVMPEWRGRKLGTRLLEALLSQAKGHDPGVSLSVSRDNPAVSLYRRCGFETVAEGTHSLTMLLRFTWRTVTVID